MKKVLIILGAIIVVLIAVVVALPFIVPKSTLTALVVEQIEEATGRKVTLGAEPEFSVFPDVTLSISEVAISNAEEGSDPTMVSIGSAEIAVSLMAALSGELVVQKFVLVDPVILVERYPSGRFNFELKPAEGAAPVASTDESASSAGGGLPISLDDVRLENARLIYIDAISGERQEIDGLNAKLSLPSADGPFDMAADAGWRGRTVQVTANIDSPMALGEGAQSAIRLTVGSEGLFDVSFEGTATAGASPQGAGRFSLDASDIPALMTWVEVALGPDVKLPATVSISGDVTGSPEQASLSGATITFDQNTLNGSLSGGITGGKPFAVADLTAGALDLTPYLPAGNEGGGGESAPAAADGGSTDWSDEKIDLSGINAADADIRLRAESIATGIVDVGKTDVAIVVKGRRADVTIAELQLYEGRATGAAGIDMREGEPKMSVKLNVDGLQARPALQQLADYGDFLGTVTLNVDMTTRGDTERKLVSALNGGGDMVIADGAIIGYNLAAAVRDISTGGLDATYDESEKTDFAEISASFTARNGLVHNPDLKMNAPLLRVTGKGDIALPPRTIDYRALPKLVASLTGQGASEGGGLGIPILITGSWDDPSIRPDLEGVVKGVLQAPGDAVKGVTDTVKGAAEGGAGAVKGVLDSVTGGGSTSEGGETQQEEGGSAVGGAVEGATKKLKGLFGN